MICNKKRNPVLGTGENLSWAILDISMGILNYFYVYCIFFSHFIFVNGLKVQSTWFLQTFSFKRSNEFTAISSLIFFSTSALFVDPSKAYGAKDGQTIFLQNCVGKTIGNNLFTYFPTVYLSLYPSIERLSQWRWESVI